MFTSIRDARLAGLFALAPLIAAPATASDDTDSVHILIKFLPDAGQAATPTVRFIPESCQACTQLHEPAYERFNVRETILQFRVPRSRRIDMAFEAAPTQVRRAIINQTDVPMRRTNNGVTLSLPPIAVDSIWAAALATDLVEPGMVLRFEHADVARRAGAYATGRFPAVERRAADNLTFAQREVIRRLDLGTHVEAAQIGKIMVMGFDTNFPAAHTDAPPHVHMHLRWHNNIGTQIAHYYLDERGLLTQNKVGVRGLDMPSRTFAQGETFTTIDRNGQPVYSHMITEQGWLRIARPDGGACLLRPRRKGFDDGVIVDCGAAGQTTVDVRDDMENGELTVRTGPIIERLRYDVDTGHLRNDPPPPIPASARNPNE